MESRIASHFGKPARPITTALLAFLCVLATGLQAAETIGYSYDPANRLGTVQYADGQSIRYIYDNLGNQLQKLTLASAQTNTFPGRVTSTLANGATNVDTSTVIDWTDATDANTADRLVYYLYLGTDSSPPLVYSGWASNYTPPIPLTPLSTYTWKVVTRDSQGGESVSGPWTFTTGNEPPTAAIGASISEAIVSFTSTLTDISISTDDAIVSRKWDIGCNGSVEATTATTTVTVSAAGEVRICLEVIDSHGAANSTSKSLFGRLDTDRDGVFDNIDNCPAIANADQYNQDGDGLGDACDPDRDGDGVPNATDVFPDDSRYSADSDGEGIADNWETAQFGNLTTATGTSDYDADGSSDKDEFLYDSDPKLAPEMVQTAPVAAGWDHSLAQRPDGRVYAWGYNANGQIGDGTQTGRGFAAYLRASAADTLDEVESVAAGADHSLAVLADGSVVAWGHNGYGQLGDGTSTRRPYPVPVRDGFGDPVMGVAAVAAGARHSLALLDDGTVLAWGYNGNGQLGDGTTTSKSNPTRVRDSAGLPLRGILAIAAGEYFSLALRSDGTVWAWGYNGYGQLGDDTTTARAIPQRVLGVHARPISGVLAIAAGFNHALAVRADGTLLGWGRNTYGQVGNGSILDVHHAVAAVDSSGAPVSAIAAVSGGEWHSLALTDDGDVLAWGRNNAGQIGDGSAADWDVPTLIGLSDIEWISAGSEHSVAVGTNRNAYAWGENGQYQLGDGTLTDRRVPGPVLDANLDPIRPVARPATGSGADSDGDGTPDAGDAFPHDERYRTDTDGDGLPDEWELANFGNLTAAGDASDSDSDGDGASDAEELAHGSDPQVAPPIQWTALATGGSHSLALRRDGRVLAWGYNANGQLGDGTTTSRSFPVLISALANVRALAAGESFSLALTADGSVWAWGYNGSGQLGDGTTTARTLPVQVRDAGGTPLAGIVAVAAGQYHSLALRADGTLWAWGYNGNGQLGNGGTTGATSAQRVQDANGADIVGIGRIAAGWGHSLALRTDGKVLVWGYNGYGQLGDGTGTSRYRPVPAIDRNGTPLADIAKLAGGRYHSLALTAGGEVLAWGYNGQGQLGDGTTTDRSLPDRVFGADQFPLGAIADIAAGRDHSLAIAGGGSVLGWGINDNGQLGAQIQDFSKVAVTADGVADAARVVAGGAHSLVLRGDGTLLAWGDNAYGQVGDGTQWDRPWSVAVWDGNLEPIGNIGQPGTADSDGDGAPDAGDAFPYAARYKRDADGDGLPDEWEQTRMALT